MKRTYSNPNRQSVAQLWTTKYQQSGQR